MGDRRIEIFNYHAVIESNMASTVKNAMDEYFTERALELMTYIVKHTTGHSIDEEGNIEFKYKGEWISSKQLFENFL